jgi:hypothetical protein
VITLHEQYVVTAEGRKLSVVLPVEEFRRLLDELEELESIRAYDAAKAAGDEAVPLDQAITELDRPK